MKQQPFALQGQVNIGIYLVLIKLPLQGFDWIIAYSLPKASRGLGIGLN
jgi:hypothetical protein